MNLLIVESPHKAQTISQWFSKDWKIIATAGHIKNLPKNDYGINKQHQANWTLIQSKKELVAKLKTDIANSDNIFVGTDDDREGERIAFDLVEHFKIKNYYRVIFHEITKKTIASALKNAIYIDNNKVESQKARRMIDRIIGYPITTGIRWYFKKNKSLPFEDIKKIGVGRVSAAALGIIVRNEYKIENFTPEKYKKIYIDYIHNGLNFTVTNNIKFKKEHEAELEEMHKTLLDKTTSHVVESYNNKTKEIAPFPPLTTTRILRSMNYLYGYNPKETMNILQNLYDGIKINGVRTGLITYPRTDSLNISDDIVIDIISFLLEVASINKSKISPTDTREQKEAKMLFDESYVLDSKREFKNTNANAFEAHEAIRPTSISFEFSPKALKPQLNAMEHRIYEFIFYRTVSTQMKNAIYDVSNILIDIKGNKFQAFANKRLFAGWEILLGNKIKKSEDEEDVIEKTLPDNLYIGDTISPIEINIEQREEKTPPRYGIGRFITTLESNSIGRPSTIADIIGGLQARGVISIIKNMILPTEPGKLLYRFLEENANWLISIDHTKKFEDDLDKIEQGEDSMQLIEEYDKLKNDFLDKIGYDTTNKPEAWLIEKAQEIANKKGETLSPAMLANKDLLYKYYNDYKKTTKVAKCPTCKKNYIYEYDTIFKCGGYECDFFVPKESIIKFFHNLGKEIGSEAVFVFFKQLMTFKKIWVQDLYSKNKNSYYNAFVVMEKNGKYYNLKLSFPKTKQKTIDEKYIFNEFIDRKELNEKKIENKNSGYIDIKKSNPPLQNNSVEIEKLKKEKRLLEESAYKDAMTRAYNRNKFDIDTRSIEDNGMLNKIIISFIDADKFKNVNDTYGHATGDEVLKAITTVVFNVIRDHNMNLYRYGGEEFIIISLENDVATFDIMEQIRKTVEKTTVSHNENSIQITISAGISLGKNHKTVQETIEAADELVYKAKETGRNRTEIEADGIVCSNDTEDKDEILEW